MRVALISTGERDARPAPRVAGRSLMLRQLDFALACGAERVIASGEGVEEDAAMLRVAAARLGIAWGSVLSAHGLFGTISAEDELLLLQPGLLPESAQAAALLAEPRILALPSDAGTKERFERIDPHSLWAGAALLPGWLVGRLAQLPEDADPHSALLRIALQAGIERRELPRELLDAGIWNRLKPDETEEALYPARLSRLGHSGSDRAQATNSLSGRVARVLSRRLGGKLAARPYSPAIAVGLAGLVTLLGPLLAWAGYPAAGFAAIATGIVLGETAGDLRRLVAPAFDPRDTPRALPALADLAIGVVAFLAIAGEWQHRAFPAVSLLAGLRLLELSGRWPAIVTDRAVLSLAIGGFALLGWQEYAIMAWVLLILATALAQARKRRPAPAGRLPDARADAPPDTSSTEASEGQAADQRRSTGT